MNFIAIDFETANEQRNSACEIGITVVSDNRIVESKSWLIRPPELRFNYFNTQIHGIAAADVKEKPEFDVVWDNISAYFENNFVLAHNASFDISVLRSMLDTYAIPYPSLHYSCSLIISRKVWQGLDSYRLNALSHLMDIELDHHRAQSDANACAHLAIKAFKRHDVTAKEEIEEKLKVRLGKLFAGGYSPCGAISQRKTTNRTRSRLY